VGDISRVEEQIKSHETIFIKTVSQISEQSKTEKKIILQVKQRSTTMERLLSTASVTEKLRRSTLQLPDFARAQFELGTSFRLSQKVGESIENIWKSNRSIIEQFTDQTTRRIQELGASISKSSINSAIRQFGVDRVSFVRITAQAEQHRKFYKDFKFLYLNFPELESFQMSSMNINIPSLGSLIQDVLRPVSIDLKTSPIGTSTFNQVTLPSIGSVIFHASQCQRSITSEVYKLIKNSNLSQVLNSKPDGTIFLGGESASGLEINEAVEGLFSLIHESDFLDRLGERLQEFKAPIQVFVLWILDKILLAICLSVISNIITPYIQSYFDQFSFKTTREVVQAIRKIPYEININDFTSFRVVTGNRLRLRAKPSMDTRVLDELRRGKLLKVIEKRRNWTLVEVQYEDADEPIQGWVATRYIAVLRR